jgi:GTP-binding protein
MVRNDLRNVAIIAHVDHGKTTLVDAMLRQSGAFRDNQIVAERVMDSGDIERERGITILAKNCSCNYKGVKINIVDTPGHADFGGEVERVLKMVNGVLLLVDAAEGCMPQTRFVLQKALQQHLSLVVVINKIDRPDARIKEVIDEVLYLLMDLGASDEQLDSPMVFCCGRDGTASLDADKPGTDLVPLFDTILDTIRPPEGDPNAPFQMLCSSVDYNDFVGRIGIGRITNGTAKVGEDVVVCDWHNHDLMMKGRLTKLYDFQANGRVPCDNITAGDIVAFSGLPDITIGNTLCAPDHVEPLPFVKINDPTVEMTFSVNDSPFAGREGKYVTSRQIRERLQKELLKDVALKVEDSATTDAFRVMGRGEMHLSILIETMRREGYELQVSPPRVLTKVIEGKTYEPMERVVIDVPGQYQGAVMTELGKRKAVLQQMEPLGTTRTRLEFRMPSRGLFGYRNTFLTDTHGEGVINTIFDGYDVWAGMIPTRSSGSLVSFDTGDAVTYGLFNAQGRGTLIIGAGEKVYEGMVVGYTPTGDDIDVNVCKTKHLTNTRASGSDDALRLTPISPFSLEGCLEFLAPDELLEVTPKSLRIRKQILNHDLRMKATHGGRKV